MSAIPSPASGNTARLGSSFLRDVRLDNFVSWALTCSDSTIRLAITVRSRDSFSVPPLTGVSFAVTWVWETVAGA